MTKLVALSKLALVAVQAEVEEPEHGHGHMHANGEMHYGDHGHGDHGHEPEHGHGHMHANGEMHYGDHGNGHEDMEGMDPHHMNPNYDPEFTITNEEFMQLTPDQFWNDVLPKLDHTKLDDLIAEFDKDHLQKMLAGMPEMDFDMDDEHGDHHFDDDEEFDEDLDLEDDKDIDDLDEDVPEVPEHEDQEEL